MTKLDAMKARPGKTFRFGAAALCAVLLTLSIHTLPAQAPAQPQTQAGLPAHSASDTAASALGLALYDARSGLWSTLREDLAKASAVLATEQSGGSIVNIGAIRDSVDGLVSSLGGTASESGTSGNSAELAAASKISEVLAMIAASQSASPTAVQPAASLPDFAGMLGRIAHDSQAVSLDAARSDFNELSGAWAKSEAGVRSRDAGLYTDMELGMATIRRALFSDTPDFVIARSTALDLQTKSATLANHAGYSFLDAAFILFREGLEAILVIAALLAFLRKAGRNEKAPWIWSGAGLGLLLSVGLAAILGAVLGNVAFGSAREASEGIIGLGSVVLMLSVGAWLHGKSSIGKWNAYIKRNMGRALEGRSIIPLTLLSLLAVFREGAETIVFLMAIGSGIGIQQLLLGLGIAAVVLVLIGFLVIRLSVRLPIHRFFLVASILIYYLCFKILGESVQSLQASGTLNSHLVPGIPGIGFLGIYPSAEGLAFQGLFALMLAAFLVFSGMRRRKQENEKKEAAVASSGLEAAKHS